jgi:hypothetical protein
VVVVVVEVVVVVLVVVVGEVVVGIVVEDVDVVVGSDVDGGSVGGEVVVSPAVTGSSPEPPHDAITTATKTSTVMAVKASTICFWVELMRASDRRWLGGDCL